jgi:DnaK suppressor protein
MRYLTIEQRESLERSLKARTGVLVAEITAALRQKDTPESIHLANRFEQSGDEALADLELALDIASVQRDMNELKCVRETLHRIHSPEYGVCSDCAGDIPFSRLWAELAAQRCTACQIKFERTRASGTHHSL